jgi:hypothetical protein
MGADSDGMSFMCIDWIESGAAPIVVPALSDT